MDLEIKNLCVEVEGKEILKGQVQGRVVVDVNA